MIPPSGPAPPGTTLDINHGKLGNLRSPLCECCGRVGVEEDETVVVLDGLLVPPQFGLRVAAAEVGRRKVGVEAGRPVQSAIASSRRSTWS